MKRAAANVRTTIAIIVMMLIITACSQADSEPVVEAVDEQAVTITPVALFEGDERKYEPFFGYMTGAVKIDYTGNKQVMELGREIWRDGEKAEELGGSAIFFDEEQMKEGYHGEIIINMKERVMKDKKSELDIIMSMNGNTGSTTMSYSMPWDPALTAKAIIGNPTATYKADSAVPIWGIQATSTGAIYPSDLTPEYLARTEYALIFTVRFQDRSEFDSAQ
jgi:hypothetical protein